MATCGAHCWPSKIYVLWFHLGCCSEFRILYFWIPSHKNLLVFVVLNVDFMGFVIQGFDGKVSFISLVITWCGVGSKCRAQYTFPISREGLLLGVLCGPSYMFLEGYQLHLHMIDLNIILCLIFNNNAFVHSKKKKTLIYCVSMHLLLFLN